MLLKPGLRLESATCDAQVVVVKAPKDQPDLDLRCGGDRLPVTAEGEATLLGKRYADEELGLEVLCSQAGDGALTVGTTPLLVKGAKPLPSSD